MRPLGSDYLPTMFWGVTVNIMIRFMMMTLVVMRVVVVTVVATPALHPSNPYPLVQLHSQVAIPFFGYKATSTSWAVAHCPDPNAPAK